MKSRGLSWSIGTTVLLFVFLLMFLLAFSAFPSGADAAEMRLSGPDAFPEYVEISGAWVAWDDYNVDPAVIHWRNLETGAQGTVAVPGLLGRRGTSWTVGGGFLVWHIWSEGPEGGLYTEDLLTHERRKASASNEVGGFVTDGPLLYWLEGDLLHRLNMSNGATKTFSAPNDAYNFDVSGDWMVWIDFVESEELGAEGAIYARNLASGEQSALGSTIWANLSGTSDPPAVFVDGRWVVWTSDKSFQEEDWGDTSAFAYDLETRQSIALEERIGPGQDPHWLRISDGWIAWMDARDDRLRSYVMNLAAPSAVPIPVAKTPGYQYRAEADSSWVVWIDGRETTYDSATTSVYARGLGDEPAEAFSDIADSGYREAIETLTAAGVIGGYSDGTYRPQNTLLRAQFAKMLVGGLGLEVAEGAMDFTFRDVERPEDDLYPDDYVAVAAANGIVNGFSSTRFGPYQPVTRIQMVSMVVRALERLRPGRLDQPPAGWESSFSEATDPTHGKNVRMAEYNGLLANWGLLETWSLWDPATRGEMAHMLWSALGEEFAPLWTTGKATTSLAQLETQLRTQLDPGKSIYLPSRLPAGWAVAQAPLPPNVSNSSENPRIEANGYYEVAFTNGSSVIVLEARQELGDPEPFTPNIPTNLRFEGREIELFYCGHVPLCYWFGAGEPRGWMLTASDPWSRDDVLAFAAAIKRLAGPSELTPDDMKVMSDWGDPKDLTVRNYRFFGNWAAAIIDQDGPVPSEGPPPMGCLCVFKWEPSGWTVFDQSSFIGEIDLFPRLRSEGAPEEVVQWLEAEMGF